MRLSRPGANRQLFPPQAATLIRFSGEWRGAEHQQNPPPGTQRTGPTRLRPPACVRAHHRGYNWSAPVLSRRENFTDVVPRETTTNKDVSRRVQCRMRVQLSRSRCSGCGVSRNNRLPYIVVTGGCANVRAAVRGNPGQDEPG